MEKVNVCLFLFILINAVLLFLVFLLPLAVECKATLAVAHHAKACPVEEVLTLLQVFVNTGVRAFDEYVTSSGQEFKFCGDVARLHLQLNHLKRLV